VTLTERHRILEIPTRFKSTLEIRTAVYTIPIKFTRTLKTCFDYNYESNRQRSVIPKKRQKLIKRERVIIFI